MKRKIFLITILIALFFAPLIIAQETGEESTISGEKIEDIRKEIQKKVEEKLSQITDNVKKRAWIGEIEEKTETNLKLKSRDGETRTVTISDEVKVINNKRKEIKFEDLKTGQRIIAMGYLQVDTSLEAKRIVIIPETKERERRVVFGTINNKSEEDEIISITSNNNGEENKEYEIILTTKTVLKEKTENKIKEINKFVSSKINYQDLKTDQRVIAVLIPTSGNGSTFNAKLIFVLTPISSKASNETEK